VLGKQTSLLSLAAALALAAFMGFTARDAYLAIKVKAEAQEASVVSFQNWKRQYTQLLPVEKRWNESLRTVAGVKDIYTLYGLVGPRPHTNPDVLLVDRIDRLTEDGKDLGASRVCISSSGAPGLVFEQASFRELFDGLNTQVQRADLQVGSLTFSYEKGKARAVVGEYCLVMRDDIKEAK
jgi:hypothetical protein